MSNSDQSAAIMLAALHAAMWFLAIPWAHALPPSERGVAMIFIAYGVCAISIFVLVRAHRAKQMDWNR